MLSANIDDLQFLIPESVVAQKSVQFQSVQQDSGQDTSGQGSSIEVDQLSLQEPIDHEGSHVQQREQQEQEEQQSQSQQHLELPQVVSPDLAHFTITSSPPVNDTSNNINNNNNLDNQPDLETFTSYPAGVSPSNAAYKTALDGLLSLGNDCHLPLDNFVPAVENAVHSVDESRAESLSQPQPTAVAGSVRPSSDLDFPNCRLMPQDRAINLLRHYRYHLARWVC